ncbi:MAG TPA: hypothetical protein VK386_07535 [Acidimicrobiales bacterium]|nr:hypothetical protein [Acidimicrobiales bacterium]
MLSHDVLDVADKLWRGEIDVAELHPVGGNIAPLAEPAEGVAFVPSFANVSAFSTGDGLVLVDTGSSFVAKTVHRELRRWSPDRLHTAVYSGAALAHRVPLSRHHLPLPAGPRGGRHHLRAASRPG